jgi:hypothetical protein
MAKTNLTINREDESIIFDRAQIPVGNWRNFSGGPTRFNRSNTKRFFEVFLTEEEGQRLKDAGWNVKYLESRNESEPRQAHLQVFINYDVPKRFQPKIWMTRTKGNPVLMDEELVGQLDTDDIVRAKLQIRPYDWELDNGTSGRKAMLKQAYFTIEEDDFGAEFYHDSIESDEEEIPFA